MDLEVEVAADGAGVAGLADGADAPAGGDEIEALMGAAAAARHAELADVATGPVPL